MLGQLYCLGKRPRLHPWKVFGECLRRDKVVEYPLCQCFRLVAGCPYKSLDVLYLPVFFGQRAQAKGAQCGPLSIRHLGPDSIFRSLFQCWDLKGTFTFQLSQPKIKESQTFRTGADLHNCRIKVEILKLHIVCLIIYRRAASMLWSLGRMLLGSSVV